MTSSLRRAVATVSLALAGAAALTACSEDTAADFDTPEQQPTAAADDAKVEPAAGGAEPDKPEAAPVGPDDAIETIVYQLPGADERDEATVTVGLHALRVDGEVTVLELSFTPEFRGEDTYSIYEMNGGNRISPVLNDRENLKQYTVLGGSGYDGWATDSGPLQPEVASGQTLRYWAHFAAPEDDIDTLSVGVGPVEFENVTLER